MRLNVNKSFREGAAKILPPLVREFMDKSNRVIDHPNRLKDLHRLRITGKRLRYIMEIYGSSYGKEYNKMLKGIVGMIEMMGLIHDRDVLVGEVRLFCDQIEEYNQNISEHENRIPLAPLKQLMMKSRSKRRETFEYLSVALNDWIKFYSESKVFMIISKWKK